MLHRKKVAVFSETNTKQILCGKNVQFFNVKPVGASNKQ
jgi:hypothetical protein